MIFTLVIEEKASERKYMKYKVVVDIYPKTIPGTNGCHKYVFGEYKTKREAESVGASINASTGYIGVATVEKVTAY